MNYFTLSNSDTSHLRFNGQVKEKDYQIKILVGEDLPRVSIKQNGEIVFNETLKSIDDLKIFLEECFYRYFELILRLRKVKSAISKSKINDFSHYETFAF